MSRISAAALEIFSNKRQKKMGEGLLVASSASKIINDSADGKQDPPKPQGGIPSAAARLFMGKLKNRAIPLYCTTEPPRPTPSCGSTCLQGCSLKTQLEDEVPVEDVSSEEEISDIEIKASGENSSDEDAADAFENFQQVKISAPSSSPPSSPTTTANKKLTRQKGDAESLKQYAYGRKRLIQTFIHIFLRNYYKFDRIIVHGAG